MLKLVKEIKGLSKKKLHFKVYTGYTDELQWGVSLSRH